MDVESGRGAARAARRKPWRAELVLAYQSLGVVYGEVATSPLYVYKSAFAGGDIEHSAGNEEIYGVLSLVFWTLTLIPLLKYVLIVLRADDNGEGGTFALYSLICRRVRAGLLLGGDELTGQRDGATPASVSSVRGALERHRVLQRLLLLLALLGTCMVIGDGVLTPAALLSLVSPSSSPGDLLRSWSFFQFSFFCSLSLHCASVSHQPFVFRKHIQ